MPKLYFRFGAMSSSKSMNMLMVAHNYLKQNKQVVIIKPKLDTRVDNTKVVSRTGMSMSVDILVDKNTDLVRDVNQYCRTLGMISCILIDECQFLEPKYIDHLRSISSGIPVICHGLRTDFRTELFPASKRLMEIADSVEDVKTTCMYCNRKAIINAKFKKVDGTQVIVKSGEEAIEIGGDELYQPMCWEVLVCFKIII